MTLEALVRGGWCGVGRYGYIYNASGERTAKGTITPVSDPTTTPLSCNLAGFRLIKAYILGQGGQQLTTLDQNGDWVRTNVYAGGALVAAYDSEGQHFQVSNPLGSRRVQTDGQGWYEAAWVSPPYGDGPTPLSFQHAAPTADDATPLHFTGKHLDAETQNYYFGARYYNWHTGRFLIPDWSAKVEPVPYAKLDDPQSLNLYGYMLNNPPERSRCGWALCGGFFGPQLRDLPAGSQSVHGTRLED